MTKGAASLPYNFYRKHEQNVVMYIAFFPLTNCIVQQVPDLVQSLSGLYAMMESRVGAFTKLCKLQGRLDLMLSQVNVF